MPATYEIIEAKTLATAVADVNFTSIPQTYTDLVLVITGTSASSFNAGFRLNSDNGSNYSYTDIRSNGTTALSTRTSGNTFGYFQTVGRFDTGSMFIGTFNFMNYSNTTTFKTMIGRAGNMGTTSGTDLIVNLWRSTSAITSINILSETGANYSIGCTFTLYGIKAA